MCVEVAFIPVDADDADDVVASTAKFFFLNNEIINFGS